MSVDQSFEGSSFELDEEIVFIRRENTEAQPCEISLSVYTSEETSESFSNISTILDSSTTVPPRTGCLTVLNEQESQLQEVEQLIDQHQVDEQQHIVEEEAEESKQQHIQNETTTTTTKEEEEEEEGDDDNNNVEAHEEEDGDEEKDEQARHLTEEQKEEQITSHQQTVQTKAQEKCLEAAAFVTEYYQAEAVSCEKEAGEKQLHLFDKCVQQQATSIENSQAAISERQRILERLRMQREDLLRSSSSSFSTSSSSSSSISSSATTPSPLPLSTGQPTVTIERLTTIEAAKAKLAHLQAVKKALEEQAKQRQEASEQENDQQDSSTKNVAEQFTTPDIIQSKKQKSRQIKWADDYGMRLNDSTDNMYSPHCDAPPPSGCIKAASKLAISITSSSVTSATSSATTSSSLPSSISTSTSTTSSRATAATRKPSFNTRTTPSSTTAKPVTKTPILRKKTFPITGTPTKPRQ